MKKKIVGIFVMTLLIATVFPAVGAMNSYNIYPMTGEVKDQYQEWSDECIYIDDYEWQEFVPTLAKHTRVEVKIVQWYSGSPDLMLSIEKPLGTVLTSKALPANSIPSGTCDWVSFDIPDVTLIPGQNYYIKLTAPLGSEYGWGIAYNGLYPPGTSSKDPADWCFRTFCEEEEEPVPDLDCEGSLGWSNVQPGSTVTGTIYVRNVGDLGSKLDWKVCGNPPWGTWTFNPPNGQDLTPAQGLKPITVTVAAPNQQNQQYTGQITLCNEDDNTDRCTIQVSLATPKNKLLSCYPLFFKFLENHPILYQLLQRFLQL